MLFSSIAQPLLEGFGSLILTWIEARKAKSNENIAGSQLKIQEMVEPKEISRHIIGFASDEPYDDEEEPEEEEDDS